MISQKDNIIKILAIEPIDNVHPIPISSEVRTVHRLSFNNDNCADIFELEFDSKIPRNNNTSYQLAAKVGIFDMVKFVIKSDTILIIPAASTNAPHLFVANLSRDIINYPDSIDKSGDNCYRIYWKQTLFQGTLIIAGKQWAFPILTSMPNAVEMQLNFGAVFGEIIFNNCADFKDVRLRLSRSTEQETYVASIKEHATKLQTPATSINPTSKKSRCLSCNCTMM